MRIVPAAATPEVYRALQRIKEKTGEKWSPEFVLAAVREGRAGLFEIVELEHIAWMVCERMDQGGGVWMNVWCVEGDGLESIDSIMPLIDEVANSIGAVRDGKPVWRCTGRKGWERASKGALKPVAVVYERNFL